MKSSINTFLIWFMGSSIIFAPPAAGQQGDSMKEFHEWEMRRNALNRVGESRSSASTEHRRARVAPQRREDFRRIQALNNELTEEFSRGGPLNLRLVSKSASEMNKRAKRLMVNLSLSDPQPRPERIKAEIEATPDQLRSSLLVLGESITRFVNNPAFRGARLVNARMMAQAGHDLDEIIELSSQVKECSERLAKAAGATSNSGSQQTRN